MRAALLAISLAACGTAEALQPDGGQPDSGTFDVNGPVWGLTLAAPPWIGSLCHTAADCVPAGAANQAGVKCVQLPQQYGYKSGYCEGAPRIACEVYVVDGGKGAESACGPRTCCEGPVEFPTDGGPWRRIPGVGTCGAGAAYCGFRYGYPGWEP